MNQEQRQAYSQKDQRRKKLFERKYVPLVYNALQEQMKQASDVLQRSGVDGLHFLLDKMVFVQDLAPVIRDLWVDIAVYYGNKTLREINASTKKAGFGFNEKWIADILEYFSRRLLAKSVLPISQTTKEHILKILEKGTKEGWGIDRMVFELENSDITLWRARLIFRSESVLAQHYGQNLGKQESPYETQEEWIAADDARTRKSHNEIDGAVIKSGGRFRVARYKGKRLVGYDMMTGPGDPTAHAENICNCRCTSAVTARRDEKGNLIRKRKISVILPGQPRSALPVVTI
jgi:hypothetical protein